MLAPQRTRTQVLRYRLCRPYYGVVSRGAGGVWHGWTYPAGATDGPGVAWIRTGVGR